MPDKYASETDRFLKALRGQHSNIYETLGDPGLYGAMSNYTGSSHLLDAATSNALGNALAGGGVGLVTGPMLLAALNISEPPKSFGRASGIAGAATGLGLGALGAIAKYYLGKGAANVGQE